MKKKIDIAILKAIKDSNLPVGATFLSRQLKIPSATIGREMTYYEAIGLLKKISNKGRQLTEAGESYLEKQQVRDSKLHTANELVNISESISKDKLIEVLEVRKLLEGKAVELACRYGTKEELVELDRIMAEYLFAVKGGHLGEKQDLEFHLYIAEMARNTTLYNTLKLILVQDEAYSKFSHAIKGIFSSQMELHEQITKAIINRDVDNATQLTVMNLDRIINEIRKSKGIF